MSPTLTINSTLLELLVCLWLCLSLLNLTFCFMMGSVLLLFWHLAEPLQLSFFFFFVMFFRLSKTVVCWGKSCCRIMDCLWFLFRLPPARILRATGSTSRPFLCVCVCVRLVWRGRCVDNTPPAPLLPRSPPVLPRGARPFSLADGHWWFQFYRGTPPKLGTILGIDFSPVALAVVFLAPIDSVSEI